METKKKKIMGAVKFQYFFLFILFGQCLNAQKKNENYISFKSAKEVGSYFAYKADNSVLVSAHRGGREPGFPENSIENFQHVLEYMPAFFEIDPRLTKDSVIVLMHDATLDRTTDMSGKLADYTWAELQSVRLKDNKGNVTSAKIPTLEDVIVWSKGKTVINLDKKDVPPHMIVALIKKHKAEKHVMATVHTGAQARYYSDHLPGIMLSVFCRNEKEYEDILICGVPWKNMIAYVGPTIDESNKRIVENLRAKGVRCMVSYAPTHDTLNAMEERQDAYKKDMEKRPDIIESDFPLEIWSILKK
ncbi:MAG: glycerophosphodiester phosphodiesterase family protein [Tannerella sp.]|jgi:glycerophosphoryl diester phosphodiesterase|nr:glycerophosphodiester phosphodiesterase family protein [Tannerella sp.]